MKRLLFLFAFALLLVACSSEDPTEIEVSQELNNENDTDESDNTEDDDNPDEGPNKELERSMTLIPPALEEMPTWESVVINSSSEGFFKDDEFDYKHYGYMEYIPGTKEIYVSIERPEMEEDTLMYYGSGDPNSSGMAYTGTSNGFYDIEATTGVFKDHLAFRHELMKFAHEHGVDRVAEIDQNFITETMIIPQEYHEELSNLLREVTEIEVLYDLDYKTEFKNVTFAIILDGIDIYGFTIHIEYLDNDIDGATDFVYWENYEQVNELDSVTNPIAG